MRRAVLAALASALLLAPSAGASSRVARPNLAQSQAVQLFLATAKVHDWVGRYPPESVLPSATFQPASRNWAVAVWSTVSPPAIEIAKGRVDDRTGAVTKAWTGPQVEWRMARGINGFIGGKTINSAPVWLAFCAVFLLGLADLRRLISLRNLDLLVLLSFTISLWYFNHGRIFTGAPLVYPPLIYLLARMAWAGRRGRAPAASRPVWPVWLLAAATILLVGFRVGINVHDSRVIDIGASSLIGAQRIAHGQAPYGHMPEDADRGDTYGPVSYQAYLPAYWTIGSGGENDNLAAAYVQAGWGAKGYKLDAARLTSILFDLLCIVGLVLVGRRFGGARLAVTLAFAWAAYPFTQYALSSNTNDAVQAALLIFGFWLASSPGARGAFSALASWTKFAPVFLVPLWATYPDARGRPRPKVVFASAFLVTTLIAFWILLLEPNPLHATRVFWDRTLGFQLKRDSPLSIWDWRQYHAGLPDLHVLQRVLEVALVIGALAVAFVPRRKSPLQLAALTAAVLIGVELVMTHWFYPYLTWFFPFVAFVVLAPAGAPARTQAPTETRERESRELVTAG